MQPKIRQQTKHNLLEVNAKSGKQRHLFVKLKKIGKHTLLADDRTDEAGSGRLHCMRNGSFRKLSIILFL